MEDQDKIQQEPEEAGSFVEMLTDGEGHSPQPDEAQAQPQEQKQEQEQSAPDQQSDSVQAEIERLNGLLERANKRLHDTQTRLHEECSKRAELQKELSDFQKREDDPDDWFSDKDKDRKQELEKQIAESDERLRQIDESASAQADDAKEDWLAAAERAAKDHPDFAQKVYRELGSLIDPQNKDFNPAIRQAWDAAPDKSPAGAYKFATNMSECMEMVKDPAAYREKVRQEVLKETGRDKPFGSEGLDMVNSASGAAPPQTEPDGFVETLFK